MVQGARVAGRADGGGGQAEQQVREEAGGDGQHEAREVVGGAAHAPVPPGQAVHHAVGGDVGQRHGDEAAQRGGKVDVAGRGGRHVVGGRVQHLGQGLADHNGAQEAGRLVHDDPEDERVDEAEHHLHRHRRRSAPRRPLRPLHAGQARDAPEPAAELFGPPAAGAGADGRVGEEAGLVRLDDGDGRVLGLVLGGAGPGWTHLHQGQRRELQRL